MSTRPTSPRSSSGREARRSWPGLAFFRVFSDANTALIEAIQWKQANVAGEARLMDIPAEWPVMLAEEFLHLRVAGRETATDESKPANVRVEMGRLLMELRGAALRGGYFARIEDATLFTDEVGALLLSARARVEWPSFRVLRKHSAHESAAWRWDAARGVIAREEGEHTLAGERTRLQRVMTLDDEGLAALLEGRSDISPKNSGTVLVLNDDLLLAAEKDHAARGQTGTEARSGACELLECIAQAALRNGDLELFFADSVRRSDPLELQGADDAWMDGASAASASLDLARFLMPDGQLNLAELGHAAALLVTMLEIEIDGRAYPNERLATRAHNERRLAIELSGVSRALLAGGVDPSSASAHAIIGCLMALLGGEGLRQSARIAETCPALRVAQPQERSRRAGDLADREAWRIEDSACPAFREQRDRVIAWIRSQRAQAHDLTVPVMSRTSDVISMLHGVSSEEREVATMSPLVEQLPAMIADVRRVWDAVLLQAERHGLRHIGVGGPARLSPDGLENGLGEQVSSAEAVFSEHSLTQVGLHAVCQPFVTAWSPCKIEVQHDLPKHELARTLLEGWRSGLYGVSLRQREHVEGTKDLIGAGNWNVGGGEQMRMGGHTQGQKDAEDVSVPARGMPVSTDASAASAEQASDLAVEQSATPLSGEVRERHVTLAEAERAAMERGHTTLVETQLQRISELEEQLKLVQAKARENGEAYDAKEPPRAMRHRLPAERASVTHAFLINGHEGHITVGLYPNGSPGEIFLQMTKEGSALAGLLDSFATAVSLALQHGVPVRVLAAHFTEMRFEPSGATANDQIPYALSIMDYLFRWIELRFLSGHQMDLFANLAPSPEQANAVRVTGKISGPKSSVVPNLMSTRTELNS